MVFTAFPLPYGCLRKNCRSLLDSDCTELNRGRQGSGGCSLYVILASFRVEISAQ